MKDLLTEVKAKLSQVAESDWTVEGVKNQIWDWSGEIGRGSVLHPLRTCLSGRKQSPDPFTLAYVLGKEETLSRIGRCL
jgi:glutamyl/glutaminyl-tRNA synthetase